MASLLCYLFFRHMCVGLPSQACPVNMLESTCGWVGHSLRA